jgi:hypothetical protein
MKKLILMTVLVSLVFILGNTSTGSVFASSFPAGGSSGGTGEWILQTTNTRVEFYYKIDDCNGENAVYLKIINKNNYKVSLKWEEVYVDKKSGASIKNFSGQKELIVSANTTVEASCNSKEHAECLIPFSMVTPTAVLDVQSLEFKNISVTVSQ